MISSSKELWRYNSPNYPFSQLPIFLFAATENHDNIRQCMNDIINPETDQMRVEGFSLADQHVSVDIVRSMFDGNWLAFSQAQEVQVINCLGQLRKSCKK